MCAELRQSEPLEGSPRWFVRSAHSAGPVSSTLLQRTLDRVTDAPVASPAHERRFAEFHGRLKLGDEALYLFEESPARAALNDTDSRRRGRLSDDRSNVAIGTPPKRPNDSASEHKPREAKSAAAMTRLTSCTGDVGPRRGRVYSEPGLVANDSELSQPRRDNPTSAQPASMLRSDPWRPPVA